MVITTIGIASDLGAYLAVYAYLWLGEVENRREFGCKPTFGMSGHEAKSCAVPPAALA